jgi:hypothetical protein
LTTVSPDVDVSVAHFDREARELAFRVARAPDRPGDATVVIGNLEAAGAEFTVREGDRVIGEGGRGVTFTSHHPDLRADAEGLELNCRDDRAHRYTVSFTGPVA